MIYNDIAKMLDDASKVSGIKSKHLVFVDGDNVKIQSPKLPDIALSLKGLKSAIKNDTQSRMLVRHICRLNNCKYNSSMQNIADKVTALVLS